MTAEACRFCGAHLTDDTHDLAGNRHCGNRSCDWCKRCVAAKEREARS